MNRISLAGSIGLLAAVAVSPAFAQSGVLEEIVVTAQKREESMQDVGISISAFSGDQIRKLGFTNSIEAVAQIPNAEVFSPFGAGQNANLVIRGVGLNDYNNGNEAPVTAYIDEFYLISLSTLDFQMFDLQRAEVLRGPQGTLFGRNSNGGLFHFITKKPTDEVEGYGELTIAEHGEVKLEGGIGGPLSDNVRGRISASTYRNDGFQKAMIPGVPDGDQRDVWAIRGQLVWDVSDALTASLKLEHSEVDSILPSYEHFTSFLDADGLENFLPANVDAYGTGPGNDFFGFRGSGNAHETFNGDIATIKLDVDHALLRLEWDLGSAILTSVTGWMDVAKDYFDRDFDGSPISGVGALGIGDANEFGGPYFTDYITQEIRLQGETDSMRWTTGIYYLSQDAGEPAGRLNLYGGQDYVDGGLLTQPFPILAEFEWTQSAKSIAAFAQAEFDVSDTVSLTFGARASTEEKRFTQDYRIGDPFDILELGALPFPPVSLPWYPYDAATVGDLANIDDELFTGKAQLNWSASDEVLVFASFSRGQKVGGFNNGQIPFVLPEDVRFKPETLNAYEIGFKSTLASGRARLNGTVFYYDYKDFQTFAFKGISPITSNKDANLSGAELELYATPTDQLDVVLGISVLDTELQGVSNGVIVRDTEMALAPKISLNGLFRYSWPLASGNLSAQLDFVYSDEKYADAVNHPSLLLPSYTRTNIQVAYANSDDSWEVAVFAKNATDEEYRVTAFPLADFFGMTQSVSGPPRQVGVKVAMTF